MSYCHLCSGGYSNIDYTFGGKYSGTGPRDNINSYTNSPLAGSVSNNPRQVSVKMWDHVSSRGTCTEPYSIAVSISPNAVVVFYFYRTHARVHPLTRPLPPPLTFADADAHVEAHAESHYVEAHAETHSPYRETGQSDKPALYNSNDR